MSNTAADIASFGEDFWTELVLDGNREFIRLVRLEIGVEGFAGTGGDVVEARIPWLRQVLRRRGKWRYTRASSGAVDADSESSDRRT